MEEILTLFASGGVINSEGKRKGKLWVAYPGVEDDTRAKVDSVVVDVPSARISNVGVDAERY